MAATGFTDPKRPIKAARIALYVHVQQVRGAVVDDMDALAAAVAEHVGQSGQFTFTVGLSSDCFAATRFVVTRAERLP